MLHSILQESYIIQQLDISIPDDNSSFPRHTNVVFGYFIERSFERRHRHATVFQKAAVRQNYHSLTYRPFLQAYSKYHGHIFNISPCKIPSHHYLVLDLADMQSSYNYNSINFVPLNVATKVFANIL